MKQKLTAHRRVEGSDSYVVGIKFENIHRRLFLVGAANEMVREVERMHDFAIFDLHSIYSDEHYLAD